MRVQRSVIAPEPFDMFTRASRWPSRQHPRRDPEGHPQGGDPVDPPADPVDPADPPADPPQDPADPPADVDWKKGIAQARSGSEEEPRCRRPSWRRSRHRSGPPRRRQRRKQPTPRLTPKPHALKPHANAQPANTDCPTKTSTSSKAYQPTSSTPKRKHSPNASKLPHPPASPDSPQAAQKKKPNPQRSAAPSPPTTPRSLPWL